MFSRDRPAQLDLLLRSLKRYAPSEKTFVLVGTPTTEFVVGYAKVARSEAFWFEGQGDDSRTTFQELLLDGLARDDTVTFFCDDDVVYRPLPFDPRNAIADMRVLCHSWRLAGPPAAPYIAVQWDWTKLPRTGRGYPGSIDGHTFRTTDVLRMIDGQAIANPTMLETILAHRCELFVDERPLMSAWPQQVLVGVPVNRVSDQSGCDHGQRYPQTTVELNERFLAGERIALDQLDVAGVDGCHHELAFAWEPR